MVEAKNSQLEKLLEELLREFERRKLVSQAAIILLAEERAVRDLLYFQRKNGKKQRFARRLYLLVIRIMRPLQRFVPQSTPRDDFPETIDAIYTVDDKGTVHSLSQNETEQEHVK